MAHGDSGFSVGGGADERGAASANPVMPPAAGTRGSVDNHAGISYRWLGRAFRCQTAAEVHCSVDHRPPRLGLITVHAEASRPPNRCSPDEPRAAPGERTGFPAVGLPIPWPLAAEGA